VAGCASSAHHWLIAALADDLSERVAPRYYVGLERRTYLLQADDLVFVGRSDLAVAPASDTPVIASLRSRHRSALACGHEQARGVRSA
jgi:hypothetical protein